jgi:hypothetical protein
MRVAGTLLSVCKPATLLVKRVSPTTPYRPRMSTAASAGTGAAADAKAKPGSRSALEEVSEKGAFVRKDSTYRNIVKKGGEFAPEGEALRHQGKQWSPALWWLDWPGGNQM